MPVMLPGVVTDGKDGTERHQQLQVLHGLQRRSHGGRRAAAGRHAALQAARSSCHGKLLVPACSGLQGLSVTFVQSGFTR